MSESNLNRGHLVQLGATEFTENDIINYAKINDPLNFHIDLEAAKKSRFKGLVCSGSQAFNYFYVNRWIPLFGKTVEAGLGVTNWEFKKPIYANEEVLGKSTILEVQKTSNQKEIVVNWFFEFLRSDESKFQHLELKILHKTN